MPYIEQNGLFNSANFFIWKEDPTNTTTVALNVNIFDCPSDPKTQPFLHDYGFAGTNSYGPCQGNWFVWGGFSGPYNGAAFSTNQARRLAEFTDGLSQTVLAAEVKASQAAANCRDTALSLIQNPYNVPSPYANPFTVAPEYNTCNPALVGAVQFEFHAEWSDGNAHAAGFTNAWPPNYVSIGFVVARMPARPISLSTRDGSILGETPCPPQSDDLFFDPRSGLVAVIGGGALPTASDPGGAGASLDVFVIDRSGQQSRLGGSSLPPHSRTGTLVADRRTIYVAVPATQDRPAEVREYRFPE